jgi:hypothetical protein
MIALLLASLLAQGQEAKPRIALAPLRAEGTAPGVAEAVASAVAARLPARGDCEVVTDAEVARLMQQEEQRQLAGCSSEKCLADLARIADAKETSSGSVSAVGERFIVALVPRLDERRCPPPRTTRDAHRRGSRRGGRYRGRCAVGRIAAGLGLRELRRHRGQ